MVRRPQFIDIAFWCFFLDPAEEAGDRRAVAMLSRFLAGDLDRILHRLRQDGRVAHRHDLGAGLVERFEDCGDGTLGIDREAPVGFTDIRVSFAIDAPGATDEQLGALQRKTERYCVVYQTLRNPPAIAVRSRTV